MQPRLVVKLSIGTPYMIITKSPFAEMFPRLFELKDADPNPTHPDTYLQHLAELTQLRPQSRKPVEAAPNGH